MSPAMRFNTHFHLMHWHFYTENNAILFVRSILSVSIILVGKFTFSYCINLFDSANKWDTLRFAFDGTQSHRSRYRRLVGVIMILLTDLTEKRTFFGINYMYASHLFQMQSFDGFLCVNIAQQPRALIIFFVIVAFVVVVGLESIHTLFVVILTLEWV